MILMEGFWILCQNDGRIALGQVDFWWQLKNQSMFIYLFSQYSLAAPAKLLRNSREHAQATPSVHISTCALSLFSLIILNLKIKMYPQTVIFLTSFS